VHTGAFEARAYGHLASGLDKAGGRAQAMSVELRIAHTLAVGQEIMETATSQIGARNLASDGVEQSSEFFGVEFSLAAFCPLSSPWGGGAVRSFSEITQIFFDMTAVHNLGGTWRLIDSDVSASLQTRWAKGERSAAVYSAEAFSRAAHPSARFFRGNGDR